MLTATINPLHVARAHAVEFLNERAAEDDLENVEPIVAVVNELLAAAGDRPVKREYAAGVTVTIKKEFDDYIEIDEDALRDPIIEAVGDELDNLTGEVDVDEIETSISVTAQVTAEVAIELLIIDPDSDTMNGLEAAVLEAVAEHELDDDWEIDADTATIDEIKAVFI